MKHVKLSLRSLLLWVAFAAVVAAALGRPSLFWTRLLFTLAMAFIAWSIVGAFTTRGSRRTFWVGTATLALGYLLIFAGSPKQEGAVPVLPRLLLTQQLLDSAAGAMGHVVRSQWGYFDLWEELIFNSAASGIPANAGGPFGGGGMGGGMPGGARGGGGFFDVDDTMVPEDAGAQAGGVTAPGMGMGTGMGGPGAMAPAGTPAAAAPAAKPYVAYNHFLISGHFAFLILIALGGGWLAQTFFKSDDATAA